ncbi:MAG: glycosyltransferase family 4 protein, partial [Verrucomicrobiae bacterium]|nr:glycosyltransferase family 4 protein [Verrucomicrobiae bacterium]
TVNYAWFMVAGFLGAIGAGKPDVVVATSPQFFCAVAGWMASRWHRCPFVFEVRDLWPESIVTVGAMRPGLGIRALEKLELFLYGQAKRIIVVTDAFRENMVSRGVPGEKIIVIKNGVDLDFFRPGDGCGPLRKELGAEGKVIVAYIGTLGMAHALDKVVEVAEVLKECNELMFVIVGDGAERVRIERMIAEKQLLNVRLVPAVRKEKVVDYYAVSDIGLVTLRNKPLFRTVLPSKIFEWMAMAKPIVCTVQGECRELLTKAGAAVFAYPEDVKGMAEAIVALAEDRDRMQKMGKRGREFVEKNFDRDRLAREYLEVLKGVSGT